MLNHQVFIRKCKVNRRPLLGDLLLGKEVMYQFALRYGPSDTCLGNKKPPASGLSNLPFISVKPEVNMQSSK